MSLNNIKNQGGPISQQGISKPQKSIKRVADIILNKDHKKLYTDIIDFYNENKESIVEAQNTFGVGTDQPIINFFLQKQNIDLKLLSYKFNMQDMALKEILTDDLLFTKLGWIYHFNAIPNNHDSSLTLHWMKKTYEELYDNIS